MNKVMTEGGKIIQIVGVVVDVEFAKGALPAIFNALKIFFYYHLFTLKALKMLEQHVDKMESKNAFN